jgi:hypothetical protein
VAESPETLSLSERSRRLRRIGGAVLVLGLAASGLVYWLGTRSPDPMNDPSMAGFNRSRDWQLGVLCGKMGLLTAQIADGMRQPGTRARIIAGISILVAVTCFHFARRFDEARNELETRGR